MNNKGNILIIVLVVFTITVSILFDFVRRVYLFINVTENYKLSEKMATVLKAGYTYSSQQIEDFLKRLDYTDKKSETLVDRLDDITITAFVEDNNSKFNLNSMVYQNGIINLRNYEIFRRLLKNLELDEAYADRVVDFIDFDKTSRIGDSEVNAKNYFLFSLSELKYIFKPEDWEKLKPFVTVFGNGLININTADKELIMALHRDISEDLAKRIIEKRSDNPFKSRGEVIAFPQMNVIGINISDLIVVKSSSFFLNIVANKDDFKETVEVSFDLDGGKIKTNYWKEY